MLRYSVLRLLIFFGVLSLLWLLGLRDPDQQWMLLVSSALISMVLSYFVLARFREESTRQLAERVQRRAEAKQAAAAAGTGTVHGRDEDAEDSEDERGSAEYR
jgi:membrane protein implicated in regulation of membrane protease activity